MTTTLFKHQLLNDLQNYIINNNVEPIFKIKEIDLTYSSGHRYMFYFHDRIVNSFEVTGLDMVEIGEQKHELSCAYEYMLGFMDAYTLMRNKINNSFQSKVIN